LVFERVDLTEVLVEGTAERSALVLEGVGRLNVLLEDAFDRRILSVTRGWQSEVASVRCHARASVLVGVGGPNVLQRGVGHEVGAVSTSTRALSVGHLSEAVLEVIDGKYLILTTIVREVGLTKTRLLAATRLLTAQSVVGALLLHSDVKLGLGISKLALELLDFVVSMHLLGDLKEGRAAAGGGEFARSKGGIGRSERALAELGIGCERRVRGRPNDRRLVDQRSKKSTRGWGDRGVLDGIAWLLYSL
jgi:hypothetical protein